MVTSESDRAQVSGGTSSASQVEVGMAGDERVSVTIRDPFWFLSLIVAGATATSLGGLGASILAIFGLSGVSTAYMVAVASIVAGVTFLMLAWVDAAWARMFRFSEHETARDRVAIASGVAAVFGAGAAAIVLGVLDLMFPGNALLTSIAVLALGVGLLWHGGITRRVRRFTDYVMYHGVEERRPVGPIAINALSLAPIRDTLVGLCGVILGILAILSIAPVVLGLVALLAIATAVTATVSTICGATLSTLKGVCSKS